MILLSWVSEYSTGLFRIRIGKHHFIFYGDKVFRCGKRGYRE